MIYYKINTLLLSIGHAECNITEFFTLSDTTLISGQIKIIAGQALSACNHFADGTLNKHKVITGFVNNIFHIRDKVSRHDISRVVACGETNCFRMTTEVCDHRRF
ncbi:hypothetical protein SDC9_91144 [bioreactor metagenome]|uniref:Uncharacterized protein n=1 Tax=bioreactor metagenome TaxID=1076179 RepID=A0A644ZUR5_9ZZZZ